MEITKVNVQKLIKLINPGLNAGGGGGDGTFCVQEAVNCVFTGETSDHPHKCVNEDLIGFGICLNDADGWQSDKGRARGLVRFAIAELGTQKMDLSKFQDEFVKRYNQIHNTNYETDDEILENCLSTKALTGAANLAASILKKFKTPGSKWLSLLTPRKKKPIQRKEEITEPSWASQQASKTHVTTKVRV